MNYENTKLSILQYIEDRNKYLEIYRDIKTNIDTFKSVTKPYKYIPKELLEDFFEHMDKILKEHSDVFDIDNKR